MHNFIIKSSIRELDSADQQVVALIFREEYAMRFQLVSCYGNKGNKNVQAEYLLFSKRVPILIFDYKQVSVKDHAKLTTGKLQCENLAFYSIASCCIVSTSSKIFLKFYC